MFDEQMWPLFSEAYICQAITSWRWFEGRGEAVYDDQGTPTRFYGVCMDITARKCHERQLALSAAIAQDLVNPVTVPEMLGLVAEKVATFFDVTSCAVAELLPGSGSGSGSFVRLCGWDRRDNQLLRATLRLEDFLEEKNLGIPLSPTLVEKRVGSSKAVHQAVMKAVEPHL